MANVTRVHMRLVSGEEEEGKREEETGVAESLLTCKFGVSVA